MRVLIIGAMGLVGRRVLLQRLALGDQVTVMSRDRGRAQRMLVGLGLTGIEIVEGDPAVPGPWQDAVDGQDVVIMLAGAGVADRRWSRRYLQLIRDSRVDGTYQVVQAIERARSRPSLLLSASAVGYYGDRGSVLTDERAPVGDDVLADICMQWEEQAIRAEPLCRVVRMRFGVILDASGGALGRMLPIFRKGLGGRLGSGRQYMSWIAWHDVVGSIDHLIAHGDAQGAFNIVTPNAVTNREFTVALATLLNRPAFMAVPGPMLRLVAGGLAHTLLTGQRVWPAKLMESGYEFRYPAIERALATVLNIEPPLRTAAPRARTALRTMPEDIRLVGLDVDGLLPDSIPVQTVLAQYASGSMQVVLSSSDGLEPARRFQHRCGQSFPMIIADGAVLLSGEGKVISARLLSPELVDELGRFACAQDEPLHLTFETVKGDVVQVESVPGGSVVAPEGIFRIRVDGAEAPRVMFEAAVRDSLWKQRRIALHRSSGGAVDIIHPMADRGIAVQDVARRTGSPRETVMGVVSCDRSAGLAEWCGFSVALGDASATIQDLADATTEAPSVEGLAEALRTWIRREDPRLQGQA
ncbi:MAG: TIGR01777 family protein [Phycisphaerae bacterium]|nr:TIGR01777 family protein [Phycisphaerae bacterium]